MHLPYDFAGYCKHIVALLLTYIHEPDEFTERKSLAALVTMLAKLADLHPYNVPGHKLHFSIL